MPSTLSATDARDADPQTAKAGAARRVTPSRVDPRTAKPFTLDQELEPFGNWVGEPIWAPPMNATREMAETMYRQSGLFTSQEARWDTVVEAHRDDFTQVREIELDRASIRLPKGRFFVSVTGRKHFDRIAEEIPACVQTRLDEFLTGPGKRRGVKVWYFKPLCVEVCDHLVLTTREDLTRAIQRIQEEVFAEHRSMAPLWRTRDAAVATLNAGLAVPRAIATYYRRRREKAIAAYQAKLEFKRRKIALGAARNFNKRRTSGCTFDEMYDLTDPLKERDVIEQYSIDNKLPSWKRDRLFQLAAGSAPWFVTLSLVALKLAELSVMAAPSVAVCDPAFVAELPERPGELLKIGHFDEVNGVTHVEI